MRNSVPIGSICSLQNGRAFKPEEWSEVGTPIIRIQNLNDESKPFNYCSFEVEPRFHVKTGDLLFSWSGTPGTSFGAFFWNRGKGFLNQHIFRVDVDETHISKDYLRQALNAQLPLIMGQAHGGVGLQHITKGKLEAVEIQLPPLPEQRRIAAIMDQADALRIQRREAMSQLDSLTQSIFIEMFGDAVANDKCWPESARLGDMSEIVSGVTKGRSLDGKTTRVLPYLAVANVQDKSLSLSAIKEIAATEEEIERYRLKKDDLLLTEGGDPDKLGRGTLWNDELPECIHQNHIFRVRVSDSRVNPCFLNWLIGSQRGKQYFLRSAKQTTGIASINMTQLRGFPLLLPPIELQLQFESFVSEVKSKRKLLANSADQLDKLFASIQYKAFRGEL